MVRLVYLSFLSFVLLASPAAAEAVRKITWDDLVPTAPPLKNPFEHLTMDQRVLLHGIAGMRRAKEDGLINEVSAEYERSVQDADKLTRQGLDVEALLKRYATLEAEIKQRQEAVVDELEGKLIRMPGYALPLEFSEAGVTEILLVPYIGACIHVPPPPPNQLVFVQLNQTYSADNLYEPVWITGRMKVQRSRQSLSYVDGRSDVAAGYTLEGLKIEPYKE